MYLISDGVYDLDRLKECVLAALPPKKLLPKEFSIEISSKWFSEDDDGVRTYSDTVDWDGLAHWPANKCWIVLSPRVEFPTAWWVNEQLPGKYIRGTTFLDCWEFFVYCVAHEVYHLVQWKRTNKSKRFYKGGIKEDEFEADLFAIMQLTKWRNRVK